MQGLDLAKIEEYLGHAVVDNSCYEDGVWSFGSNKFLTYDDNQLNIQTGELPEEVWLWLVTEQPWVSEDAREELETLDRAELQLVLSNWYKETKDDYR
jgi:hypothetical protein